MKLRNWLIGAVVVLFISNGVFIYALSWKTNVITESKLNSYKIWMNHLYGARTVYDTGEPFASVYGYIRSGCAYPYVWAYDVTEFFYSTKQTFAYMKSQCQTLDQVARHLAVQENPDTRYFELLMDQLDLILNELPEEVQSMKELKELEEKMLAVSEKIERMFDSMTKTS